MKKLRYCVVRAFTHEWLERDVMHLIRYGWTPQGGVAACYDDGKRELYQAMVTTQPEDPTP